MPYVTTSVLNSPPRGLLRIRGEIDVLAAPELHRATAAVVTDGCLEVTLDLNDVSFLDSAGLDALMSCPVIRAVGWGPHTGPGSPEVAGRVGGSTSRSEVVRGPLRPRLAALDPQKPWSPLPSPAPRG
jgi:hypothetical protein